MIPTSAHAGITATRLRHGIPALAAVLLATVLLGLLGIAPPARAAATPTPTPTLSGEIELHVAPLGNGLLSPGETLNAVFSVDNGTALRAPAGDATLQLGDTALPGADALATWLDGSAAPAPARVVGTAAADSAASGASVTGSIQVAADDEALQNRAPGVYPLRLTLGDLEARSVVVVPGGATGSVGVVVPVTAGPLERGLLTSAQLETMTAPEGSLTAVLDAVDGTPAILAVDPAVPAAIRVLGTAAPATAQEWLARLLRLPNARFALQFGDADVATQIDAGLTSPMQPTSLAAYIDAATLPPEATPTPAPTDGTDPAPSMPDLATLLDIGDPAAPLVYWPAGATGPQVVAALAADAPQSVTILPSTSVTTDADAAIPARGTVDGAAVLVTDTTASAALEGASTAQDSAARAADLAAASARITLAASAEAPLLVTVDRGVDRARLGLRAAIAAATSVPGVSPTGLPDLLAATPAPVRVAEAATDAERTNAVGMLNAGADSIARFATILDDPALLTGPERAGILQVLGAGWLPQTDAWNAAIVNHRSATNETLSSVGILPSSAVNLVTAGTDLRFWVHNELPYPVNVRLFAVPDDLRVDVDRETTVTAAAASNTPVEVAVRARIGNGEVQIALGLRSPTLEPIGTDQTVDVNVRADWEGIGLLIMVVLVAGFVVIGVIRTVRRRRRVRAEQQAAGTAPADADANTDADPDAEPDADAGPDADPHPDAAGPPDDGRTP